METTKGALKTANVVLAQKLRAAEIALAETTRALTDASRERDIWKGATGEIDKMLHTVLFQQVLQHPLPWHIESDWTEEVRSASGYCIAKCRTTEDAEAIIARATALASTNQVQK